MSVKEIVQDHRDATKTICSIELTTLLEAKRFHPSEEVKAEATEIVNAAYTLQQQAIALVETINVQTIADLEDKWVDALTRKANAEDELNNLNLRTYEFTAEAARVNGRATQASHRLQEHLAVKKTWVEALLSPKDRQAWEEKRAALQASVDASRKESSELQLMVNAHNNDLATVANKVRGATAEAVSMYSKIQRLKGGTDIPVDSVTGLQGW